MKPQADAVAIGVGKRDTVAVHTEEAPVSSSPAAAATIHVDGVSVELPNYAAMGQLMGIYDAAMTHERVVELIHQCKADGHIKISGMSFDEPNIVDAVEGACRRRCDVEIVLDLSWTVHKNTCRDQRASADPIQKAGGRVLLSSGVPIAPNYAEAGRRCSQRAAMNNGIQHSKIAWIGNLCILGSTNWTTSSRCNREVSVELALTAVGIAGMETMWEENVALGARSLRRFPSPAYQWRVWLISHCRGPMGLELRMALRDGSSMGLLPWDHWRIVQCLCRLMGV